MNLLKPDKADRLLEQLRLGLSVREIAEATGHGKNTVRRYALAHGPFTCPCGRLRSQHRGWCAPRLQRSPVRQAFLAAWHVSQSGRRKQKPPRVLVERKVALRNWPYLRGKPGDSGALIAAVNAAVPRTFPDHMRADICQDILLEILEGSATVADLKSGTTAALKRYRKLHPGKFGPVSLNDCIPGTTIKRIDSIAADADHF